MSHNEINVNYDITTTFHQYLDETFHQLFIIDEYGNSIVFANLDEVIAKVIVYENITNNRLFVCKSSVGYVYRQYGCRCSRLCEFRASFGKRQSDGLVVIKNYNIHHSTYDDNE